MNARVVVLAGPSGSGKSRLARRLGLPVLNLDDFYRSIGDPALPHRHGDPGRLVDWDHPDSWLADEAAAAIETLCLDGVMDVPIYDIAHDGRNGTRRLDLAGSPIFIAEGIFAQEIVAPCRSRGYVAAAICLTQPPAVTFWRRLLRDLRERRKPPHVLVTRGLRLAVEQRRVVAHAVELGCTAMTTARAESVIADLMRTHEAS